MKISFKTVVLIFVALFLLFNFAYCFASEAGSYYKKAIECGTKGDFNEAKINFEKTAEIDLRYKSQVDEFLEILDDVSKGKIEKESVICLFKGVDYFLKNNLEDAMSEFKAAIKINPNFANAYKNIGAIYVKKGLYKEAEDELKTALKINPGYINARFALAGIYISKCGINMQKGKLDEAMAEADEALDVYPDLSIAHWAKGTIYMYKAITGKSEINIDKALKMPESFDEKFLNKAESELKKAIENSYDTDLSVLPQIYYILAEVYYFKKEYASALKYCDKSVQLGYEANPSFLKVLEPYRKKTGRK